MNRVTKAVVTDFAKQNGLAAEPLSVQFEHYSANIILNRYYGGDFRLDDVVVGQAHDTGIDGLAIIVNGRLITDLDDFIDLSKDTSSLDVAFIFIQSETSASFDSSKMGQFEFGVLDFFKDQPSLPRSQAISDRAEVMAAIYDASSKFKKEHPSCRMFYVTTGKWLNDPHLEARRQATESALNSLDQFGHVEFVPIGFKEITELHRRSENAISRTFRFPHRAPIDGIEGVKQAFIGYVAVEQYLSLIRDEDGDILPGLFYENVRHWQEYNPVNKEIQATLASGHKDRFVLMNNGVTVIAKRAVLTAHNMHIEDYQVVNGCQTSYVLHHEGDRLGTGISIPLRLIETDDDQVTASIIRATNRQTAVSEDQFLAITDFAKGLEDFFKSYSSDNPIYYERRLRQYSGTSIDRQRAITPNILIRSFASMFLEEPHSVTRSFSSVEGRVGREIFIPSHRNEPYYISAYSYYLIDRTFNARGLDAALKPARYHLLLAMRHLISSDNLPPMNSHQMGRFCDRICEILWDEGRAGALVRKAAEIIKTVASGNYQRDHIRTQIFTMRLVEECKKALAIWSC